MARRHVQTRLDAPSPKTRACALGNEQPTSAALAVLDPGLQARLRPRQRTQQQPGRLVTMSLLSTTLLRTLLAGSLVAVLLDAVARTTGHRGVGLFVAAQAGWEGVGTWSTGNGNVLTGPVSSCSSLTHIPKTCSPSADRPTRFRLWTARTDLPAVHR